MQPAVPVSEHVEQRETAAQVLVHALGAPNVMRAAFTQAEQAGAMVDLAVEQHDAGDGAVTQAPRRLQWRETLELRANVR
ncbi:hypothetical protein D3C78_1637440 [compost metagenome]